VVRDARRCVDVASFSGFWTGDLHTFV